MNLIAIIGYIGDIGDEKSKGWQEVRPTQWFAIQEAAATPKLKRQREEDMHMLWQPGLYTMAYRLELELELQRRFWYQHKWYPAEVKEEGKPMLLPSTHPPVSCWCLLLANKAVMEGWAIRQRNHLPLWYTPEQEKGKARIWDSPAQA